MLASSVLFLLSVRDEKGAKRNFALSRYSSSSSTHIHLRFSLSHTSPVTQLPALVNGMGNLLRQIEERVRAQVQQQAAQPAADAPADAAVGAFRFQG